MLLSFFLTVYLEINYLRKYLPDLHQIFRICTHMGGHDHSDHRSKTVAMVTDFWFKSVKSWHTSFSFSTLAFHNEWKNRNKDARINTADDPQRPVKI